MYYYYYRQDLVWNPLSAAYLVRWKWLNIAVIYFEVVETQDRVQVYASLSHFREGKAPIQYNNQQVTRIYSVMK